MRKLFALLVLVPAVALAQMAVSSVAVGPAAATTQTAGSAAGNVPTAAADGVVIGSTNKLRIVLSAASGQTLSGAGTLRVWFYDVGLARWVKNQNVSFTVTQSAVRDAVFENLDLGGGPTQRVYIEAVSVTSSGGALTVTLQTWRQP